MRNLGWLALPVAAAALLAVAGAFARQYAAAQVEAPAALYISQADALARTSTLACRLWPQRQDIAMTSDLSHARQGDSSPDGAPGEVSDAWQVSCEGEHGESLGTVTWNASTGELLSVVASSSRGDAGGMRFPDMTAVETRGMFRQWLRDLPGARNARDWREVHEESEFNVAVSDWVSARRRAHLIVSKSTGELITFRAERSKPTLRAAAENAPSKAGVTE